MDELNEFLDQFLQPDRPERDGSGRPLLYPRGLSERFAYSRASSLGDILEDFSYLWRWKMRGLAKGLSDSPDLSRLIAAEDYTCGFATNELANRESGRRIDSIIERALDRAGVSQKADYGTAIHSRTEPGNEGTDLDDKQIDDVDSCWQLWSDLGVVHIGTEIFTANDELMSAGTFDHLSYVPGLGVVVTDKKTSSKAKSTYDVQLSSYAWSDVYDPNTDERQTIEDFIEKAGWDPSLLRRDVGLIWWVKDGKTEARTLDLTNGYRWAKIAADVRDNRRTQGVARDVTQELRHSVAEQRVRLLSAIKSAADRDSLTELWNNPAAQAIWTDEHTAAAKGEDVS